MFLTVFYSCPACGLVKTPCQVPVRGEETVIVWMDMITECLSADHHGKSPDCDPTTLKDILIPLSGNNGKVGGPTIQ